MAVPVAVTKSWDYLATSTYEKIQPFISDIVTAQVALIHALIDNGIAEEQAGGTQLVFPVFQELQTVQAYSDLDTLTVARANPTTAAIYDWKQLSVPVQISGRDMAINLGDDVQVQRVLRVFIDSAILSMRNGMNQQLFSTNDDNAAGITGLRTFLTHVSNDDPTTGTVGRLNRATYTGWRNQVRNVASDFSANGYTRMHQLYIDCTRGDEMPDLIALTSSAYANFIINSTATFNYNLPLTAPAGDLDVGYGKVTFNRAIVIHDGHCPADNGYFINSKYAHFISHPRRNVELGPWVVPANQDAIVSHVRWMGNNCFSAMTIHGLLLNGDTN